MTPRCIKLALVLAILAAFHAYDAPGQSNMSYSIGVVGRSQDNIGFKAVRAGMNDAAKAIEKKHGISIHLIWRTPAEESVEKQIASIRQLTSEKVSAIAVSCTDPSQSIDAINSAVATGILVATFENDAPQSQRFVATTIDDVKFGEQIMEELKNALGGRGTVAILAGSQTSAYLQKRLEGARNVAGRNPDLKIKDVYYHSETPQDAASKVNQVTSSHPDINGWAFLGGWALFTDNQIKWKPGDIKCVSADVSPASLNYIRSGHVQILLSRPFHEMGYRTIEHLVDKLHFKKEPETALDIRPLVTVHKNNVNEFSNQWEKWLAE